MKRFILYSILFALLTVVLLAVGEVLCRLYPNPYSYKNAWLNRHANEVETLILGSSVNYYGINPQLLYGCTFNLAGVSQNFEYDYLLLKRYFANSDSLKRIMLSVGYATYTDPPLESGHDWMFAQGYRIYMGIDRNPKLSRYGFEIANLNGYAGKLRNMITGENSIICDTLGHGTAMSLKNKSPRWIEDINVTVARHTAPDFSHVAYNIAYLDSILDWAEYRDIEVILLSPPKHPIYRDQMPVRQKALTTRITDSIAVSRSLKWINMTDSPDCSDDDFYDGDHLTSDYGADRYTLRIRDL
ncbi:MAG: hypothetical protein K2M98_01100 [Muribaculum sp.]|nr:hypothetical protein [Muribaculum sp.]